MLIVAFLAQIVAATNREVMTKDEAYHAFAGSRYRQRGDFGLKPEHPPLAHTNLFGVGGALPPAEAAVATLPSSHRAPSTWQRFQVRWSS